MKKLKWNYDRFGIITSIACAIHCTILPLLINSLPFLGIDLLQHKAVEWSMIILAFFFGSSSLYHGYKHHHKEMLPVLLFIIGFGFLIFNQVVSERLVYIFIPASAIAIISAHTFNIYYCRMSGIKRRRTLSEYFVQEASDN